MRWKRVSAVGAGLPVASVMTSYDIWVLRVTGGASNRRFGCWYRLHGFGSCSGSWSHGVGIRSRVLAFPSTGGDI